MANHPSEPGGVPTLARRLQEIHDRFGYVDVAIVIDEGSWTVGIHFGQEAPDSPTVGGAAYGVGEDLYSALEQALSEVGV